MENSRSRENALGDHGHCVEGRRRAKISGTECGNHRGIPWSRRLVSTPARVSEPPDSVTAAASGAVHYRRNGVGICDTSLRGRHFVHGAGKGTPPVHMSLVLTLPRRVSTPPSVITKEKREN